MALGKKKLLVISRKLRKNIMLCIMAMLLIPNMILPLFGMACNPIGRALHPIGWRLLAYQNHFQVLYLKTRPPELNISPNFPDLLSTSISSFPCENIYHLTLGNIFTT